MENYENASVSVSPVADGQFVSVFLSFEDAPHAIEIARFPAGTFDAAVQDARDAHAASQDDGNAAQTPQQ